VAKSRTASSRRWLDRQHSDPYTAQAKVLGYRSRAAFKLLEIQEKDKIFKRGMTIVDLGAAPGGWSQVAVDLVGDKGHVFALDLLPMDSLAGVDILQGDFQEDAVLERLLALTPNGTVSVVMSDMAPNFTGLRAVDQPRIMLLAELSLEFAERVLCEGGTLLVKVFQGEGFQAYWAMLKKRFAQVVARKPKASRKESNEVYLLAKGYISSMRGSNVERYA